MKILVTGADGFIGSHLTELLVEEGYSVRAMVQYNSLDSRGWIDSLDERIQAELEVVSGDIRDSHFVRKSMAGCEAVMNLAALIAIPYSYVAPESYVHTNVIGALNVVQAARDSEISKVVQVSTSEVYGSAQFVPITEEHPLIGQSPYAATKIGADQIAMSYWRAYGTPVAVVRPFNTYGPRQSTRAVIPTIITQVAAGGRRIKLGALRPTRDFNFVRDTVSGMLAVLRTDASVGEVINLGTGFEITIGDTVSLIANIMGAEIEIVEGDERMRPASSEVDRLVACNQKAARLLNWSPGLSGLDGLRHGLTETAKWFQNKSNLARYRIGNYTV